MTVIKPKPKPALEPAKPIKEDSPSRVYLYAGLGVAFAAGLAFWYMKKKD